MNEHTPGPWGQDPTGDIGWWLVGTIEVPVANCDSGGLIDEDEEQANARLIAAAPELLEVAKRTRWLLAQKRYPGIERDEQAILAEAEAAIAKARAG